MTGLPSGSRASRRRCRGPRSRRGARRVGVVRLHRARADGRTAPASAPEARPSTASTASTVASQIARVADHVRVREVGDEDVVRARAMPVDERVGHAGRAHLRLEVVRGHPRARDEDAVLALERRLAAAVEEVGDVGVLLGLRDVELAPARVGDAPARQGTTSGGNATATGRSASYSVIVTTSRSCGAARPSGAARSNAVEPRVGEGVDQLARPIGAEVRVDDRLAVPERRRPRPSMTVGVHELVVSPRAYAAVDRPRPRSSARSPRPVHDRVVAGLGPLPAPVAVHREVAAADGRDPGVGMGGGKRAPRARRTNSSAERGGVSRPSSSAWRRTAATPSRAASSASATRWRSWAWTPPGPTRPTTWSRPRVSRARRPRRAAPAARRTSRRRSRRRSAAGPAGRAGRRRC